MLQPFEEFKLIYIRKLVELKKRWLVSQSYQRAHDHLADEHKIDILLTDYDSPGGANIHLNAVSHDKYAALLDLENPRHKKKLEEMLSAGSKYRLFWAVVKSSKELQGTINRMYKDNMKRWLDKNTHWRIGADKTIRPAVDVTFGELFVTLKYAGQSIRIRFDDIENM
jgi:hypothetical protein